jgi:hypothetical protein
MKLLLGTCAALLFACGGGAKNPTVPKPEPKPASACATMAANVADQFVRSGEDGITEAQREPLSAMLLRRCETDGWAAEAVTCLTTATTDTIETCGKMLTEAQEEAIEDDFEKQFEADDRQMETGAPPPTDGNGEGGSGGGGKGKAPDDPCGGGA